MCVFYRFRLSFFVVNLFWNLLCAPGYTGTIFGLAGIGGLGRENKEKEKIKKIEKLKPGKEVGGSNSSGVAFSLKKKPSSLVISGRLAVFLRRVCVW